MRCACIDIGSNTTRLLVAEAAHGRLDPVLEQRAFTRIGRQIDALGAIPEQTIATVAEVVGAQRAAAEAAGAAHIRVVATAAIRRAANRDALVAALRGRAGVEVAVLSADDEGRLAFAGATRTLEHPLAQRDRARAGVYAEHRHAARGALAVTLEDLHRRRLAGAVGAEQGKDFATRDVQVDAGYGVAFAVALAQATHLDGVVAGHSEASRA